MPKSAKTSIKTPGSVSTIPGISKSQAEKFMSKVPEENTFWCNDGRMLRNMRDLKEALAAMSDQTFAYHSNAVKQDFANWVRNVIGDSELAKELERASNREQAARIVQERYTYLTGKLT